MRVRATDEHRRRLRVVTVQFSASVREARRRGALGGGPVAPCGWRFSASVQGYRVTGAPPPHGHDGTTRCPHCGEQWARPGTPGWGPEIEQVQIAR